MASLTPMMQQYRQIKEKYKDCILFFRLGDFYEMFFDDAITASKELEIALTGRDCGLEERAPMCGVPFHSADSYIARLIDKGYKVAICEQTEDASQAKGLVNRDVVRIITPGTVTDDNMLDEKKNNFLICIYKNTGGIGLSIVDVSTGELYATQFEGNDLNARLINELARYSPTEIIANNGLIEDKPLIADIKNKFNCFLECFHDYGFEKQNAIEKIIYHFKTPTIDSTGLKEKEYAISAVGGLLEYLEQTQKIALSHISEISYYSNDEYMDLDISTRRNLELTETLRDKNKKGSLLWVLDRTRTSMGGRLIRKWIEQPLTNCIHINKRLFSVDELVKKMPERTELRELLKNIYDIERLAGKISYGSANCKDLIALKNSLKFLPDIKKLLNIFSSQLLKDLYNKFDILEDIFCLIEESITDDPPFSVREGGIIKTGYSEEVDTLRSASTEGKKWIAEIEQKERMSTGIKNLKVGFNKVFGYYIEVTKSNLENVPDTYIRKQTLSNCERYITPELKEVENKILGAEEKVVKIEYDIFIQIRDEIACHLNRLQNTAKIISIIDVLCSFAEVAEKNNYCMPDVNFTDTILIKDGRHPVVEKMLSDNMFVPNDAHLNNKDNRLSIITGPNMAGKSTYMRQIALIVLMAQIGSFVPASSAKIGIVDKIFTRVGASDDLASGQSTFMVEMNEVANIVHNATSKSLLILDEIGRGTSTYDGLSIAWSVIEYIADIKKLGAKTLFATHYHELTDLEGKIAGIKNYCIAVKKRGDDITFLRKIIRGGADDSYGIEVAKLAGVPDEIIKRAKQILKVLESSDINKSSFVKIRKALNKEPKSDKIQENQLGMFTAANSEIIEKLKKIDINVITPIEAMNILYELHKKVI